MSGRRTAVVTGASSGIGRQTATALAAQGWRVIALGRDPARSAAAADAIAAAGGDCEMLVGDLSLLSDAARLAGEITTRTTRIDVLVNNAGGVAAERRVTAEGNEGSFAGNHLGPFLLTDRLLPLLRATARASAAGAVRIVNTSSAAHEGAPGFDWADPQMLANFAATPAYCNAKLANLLFTRALARRLGADGVAVHAMHPGRVDSNFWSHGDEGMQAYGRANSLVSAAEAADTLIWLATADEPGRSTGGYWYERRAIATSAMAADEALAQRLWDESERLVARAGA